MPNYKFFTFSPDKISESLAKLLVPMLIEHKIWNQTLRNSNKYRGLKIGADPKDFDLCNKLIHKCRRILKEKNKSLKMSTSPQEQDLPPISVYEHTS